MCNGLFLEKQPDEAWDYLDSLAETAQLWDTGDRVNKPLPKPTSTPHGGLYNLRTEDDLHAKMAALTRKVEEIELRKVEPVKTIELRNECCGICDMPGHTTTDCPTIPAFKEVLHDQANAMNSYQKPYNDPFSGTYNPGWKNHPNFRWRNDGPQQAHFPTPSPPQPIYAPPPPQKPSLEDTLQSFIQGQANINAQHTKNFEEVRNQLTMLTSVLNSQEKGKLPAQPQPNPQIYGSNNASSSSSHIEHAKSIMTLRNGKVIDRTVPVGSQATSDSDLPRSNKKDKEEIEAPTSTERAECPFPPPFPQRLKPLQKLEPHSEILELFKQVKINIPLLDAIKQVPSYAKFLKDLCTVKRQLNVKKKAFLTENVSAILQHNTLPKYKDPGCPTISCIIGDFRIERALLDLGASVNLLPYSVYEQLGLGELKPTSVTLQLADRSIKIPRGIIEDVLVQVDKFYFPVDFIVLDTHPASNSQFQIPVILGRPFLATSNALINCRNGVMKLSFGNMTLELNIFNVSKQLSDPKESKEVDWVETITEECLLAEAFNGSSDDGLIDWCSKGTANLVTPVVDNSDIMMVNGWRPKVEEFKQLPSQEVKIIPAHKKACHLPLEIEHKSYWAIRNFELHDAGLARKLQLSELNEIRRDAYDNARICKERMKMSHDKSILEKSFEPLQKVLLYDSRLHLFPGKLRSRWTGPFIIKTIFPHGAFEIENPQDGKIFKVNGHRLKPFLENFADEKDSFTLEGHSYD